MEYHKKSPAGQKRNKIILAVIVVIIAIVVIAGIVFYYVGKKKNTSQDIDTTSASAQTNGEVTYKGKTYQPNRNLSNYLFIGVDSEDTLSDGGTRTAGDGGQADAIYLVSYDRQKKSLMVFLIPRDTMTTIETYSPDGKSLGESTDHLSLQYAYGDGRGKSCRLMEDAVSKLFRGIEINGYTAVDLNSIPHLTEQVQYVDVTVPDDSLTSVDPAYTKGATVRLTADNTEQFVRYRDTSASQSAIVRMNRQKAYITGYADRVRQLQQADSSTVSDIYTGLQQYMVTDMTSDVYLNLEQATNTGDYITIPGEGSQGEQFDEYHVDEDKFYQMILQYFYVEKK